MGAAYEVITGRVLNPGATVTTVTANTSDSLTVRSAPFEAGIHLEGLWTEAASAGVVILRSPRLHDNVNGIRFVSLAAAVRNKLPDNVVQRLYPQDELLLQLSGGAAETDVAALALYYADLPGISARLATWEQIAARVVNIATLTNSVTGPTTAGDWSAGENLDADFDLLKANVDYAILGYAADTQVAAVAYRGPETGNLRAGGPGPTEALETRDWFVRQSRLHGTPHIPIINAANDGTTQLFVCDAAAAATIIVNTIVAELSPGA